LRDLFFGPFYNAAFFPAIYLNGPLVPDVFRDLFLRLFLPLALQTIGRRALCSGAFFRQRHGSFFSLSGAFVIAPRDALIFFSALTGFYLSDEIFSG